eukprot:CAMPEP_0171109516 /NCGR_PEP_ID=MMETSP0766_2-20121228/70825_1 /TAXON_ID=439317 /ORGANISM="Gambierdiscus australes, Strain CAWD 149" /LENGTH=141 /DNA_ID=CAMNT_0011571265 /DNA_START=405 /DNA_END=828 /DNA_ORIENTATION=+
MPPAAPSAPALGAATPPAALAPPARAVPVPPSRGAPAPPFRGAPAPPFCAAPAPPARAAAAPPLALQSLLLLQVLAPFLELSSLGLFLQPPLLFLFLLALLFNGRGIDFHDAWGRALVVASGLAEHGSQQVGSKAEVKGLE